jgi:hypothetical protein
MKTTLRCIMRGIMSTWLIQAGVHIIYRLNVQFYIVQSIYAFAHFLDIYNLSKIRF